MLAKRQFLNALLLLTALVIIAGSATTGKSEDDYSSRYRNASDECIRFGYRRDSCDYRRCIAKRLGPEKEVSSSEQD